MNAHVAAARAPREVLRFQPALAAASGGDATLGHHGFPTAVEVDSHPTAAPTAGAASASPTVPKLPSSAGERAGDAIGPPHEPASDVVRPPHEPAGDVVGPPHEPASDVVRPPHERAGDVVAPPRDVARLEDVLKVAPRRAESIPPPTPRRIKDDSIAPGAAAAAPLAKPAHNEIEQTVARLASDEALERAKRELERLEQLLRVSPSGADAASIDIDAESVEAGESPNRGEVPLSAPSYVAAHRLRAAFLHEQTSAFEQAAALASDDEDEATATPAAQVAVPEAAPVQAESRAVIVEAAPEDHDQSARNHWLLGLCFVALIALVVALTGRCPRRCACEKS